MERHHPRKRAGVTRAPLFGVVPSQRYAVFVFQLRKAILPPSCLLPNWLNHFNANFPSNFIPRVETKHGMIWSKKMIFGQLRVSENRRL